MTLKILSNYIRYSGVWVTFGLNPCHWRFNFSYNKPDDMDPAKHSLNLAFGPVCIKLVIDDGSW
jgi:hypothetical protein